MNKYVGICNKFKKDLAFTRSIQLLAQLLFKKGVGMIYINFSEVELPSNKKFGFFFTLVFAIATGYFYKSASFTWAYVFASSVIIFLVVTLVKADLLLPLNKLWMRFGLLLGMIVSPIVFGLMFFGVCAPIALLMRMSGRDELRLKFNNKATHWISRSEPIQSDSFKHQF